ncbi:hypothetical protein [Pseudooceanicola onchidii]|uniref:hypothetical protein n=1 Tax=Pseudooceanicola onchidii TaxID=2562279 RepID=UPI0010AA9C84|nr:hypothetical protein [Pseudooceanicola onchidii]
MNPTVIFVLVAQTVLFLAWAFVAFRSLIRLNGIATERRLAEGNGPVGMSHTIATFGDFARGKVLRHDRNMLALLTLALFASMAIRASFA